MSEDHGTAMATTFAQLATATMTVSALFGTADSNHKSAFTIDLYVFNTHIGYIYRNLKFIAHFTFFPTRSTVDLEAQEIFSTINNTYQLSDSTSTNRPDPEVFNFTDAGIAFCFLEKISAIWPHANYQRAETGGRGFGLLPDDQSYSPDFQAQYRKGFAEGAKARSHALCTAGQ
jgi:hypothetical protein